MAHWMRFDHEGSIGFGTISDGAITVHVGDMFESPKATDVLLALDDVVPLWPAPAGKMVALWNNSRAMAAKTGQPEPEEPLFFIKGNGSYLPNGGIIRKPTAYDGKVIFEGELGIVIGQVCRDVAESDSDEHIFGYTCINDVTAIGLLGKDSSFQQWTRAKSFDTFGVFGPVVATGLDPATLSIKTVVNDQERQHYPVSELFFSPGRIVSAISQDMTLHPGDVICCGTSTGVGSMRPGDIVEVTIDGIGTLCNRYDDQ